jgi:hypothetical protein
MTPDSAVYVTVARLFNAATIAANTLEAVDSNVRNAFVANGKGVSGDGPLTYDMSQTAYAKTAVIFVTLTGSTPITINLNDLAAATGVQCVGAIGANSLANYWNLLMLQNIGTATLVITPGASDPANLPWTGTSAEYTMAAGDQAVWMSSAGQVVSSSACNITITPTSGGQLAIAVGGS